MTHIAAPDAGDALVIAGRRFAPQFKPGWSPELLLGYMYFSHVFAVRRERAAAMVLIDETSPRTTVAPSR